MLQVVATAHQEITVNPIARLRPAVYCVYKIQGFTFGYQVNSVMPSHHDKIRYKFNTAP